MSAKNDLQKAQEALDDPNFRGTFEFEGTRYTRTELRDVLVPLLQKRASAEAARAKEVSGAQANLVASIRKAQKRVDDAQEALSRNRNAFSKNRLTEAELAKSEANLDAAQKELDRLSTRAPFPTATFVTSTAAARAAEEERIRTEAFAGRTTPVAPTPTPSSTPDPAAPVTVTRSDVATEITSRGLPDTPENRRRVREELKAGKKRTSDWEALVREQAGEYAYLLDPKYEGVPDLLRKAVQQEWFKTEEGQKQFLQEFKKTPYALNADANQERFDLSDAGTKRDLVGAQIRKIQTEYGAVQLDGATLEEVATTAARNQADNIELGRLVYRAAFKRGAAAPDYTAPVAAKTALGGADADRIRAIYRAYGQKADDQTIARILAAETDPASGVVMTEDMLRNNLRDIAKVSYKPFADLLDRGISIETIFQPYQQIAARVLEKTPDEVSLIDANGTPTQFASALMTKEPMSLTDWMTALKSDERYGWQFTSEAKQKATSLVMDLEKAFGFRA